MKIINRDFEILTDYILAFHSVKYHNVDLIEDWAIELINSGYESEAIYSLACFYKPIDPYEVQPHLETVFAELNLTAKNEAESQKSHIRYFLNKVLKQEDVKSNLKNMLHFYSDFEIYEEKDITDLYALQYVWQDLEEGKANWYYKKLSLNTIEQEVVEMAEKWMHEN
jgi:hypothetical protein